MVLCNPLAFFFLLFIICQVSTQNYYQTPLTCYTKYEHEETRNQATNDLLNYAYSQAEMTQYTTPEGEQCSSVGCACFSYRSACSHSSSESNHYSQCTETDRQSRVVKWHRGLTSLKKCEEMRRQPQAYLDLTCCATDRCNDQPGKTTKIINSNMQIQRNDNSAYRNAPYTNQASPSYDQSLQKHNSLSSVSFSSFIICVIPLFSLFFMI